MISVLLVDDAAVIRKGMRTLLHNTTEDIRVVAEADNGVDAVRLARQLRPDVVLLDMQMPGGHGLDAVEALAGIGVEDPIAVLVYSTFDYDDYVYGALERGAVGFLLKKNPGDVPEAIRGAVHAKALNSPAIRNRLIADYARGTTRTRGSAGPAPRAADAPVTGGDSSLSELLTEREFEVAAALIDGLGNKEIATRLDISVNTVKWHLRSMLQKTGAGDRVELAVWLVQRGLRS